MRILRTLAVIVPLVYTSLCMAQPNPFGCHFFRHAPTITSLTPQDRNSIEETIARSDTFDIIHYDIQLDVSSYVSQSLYGITTITYRALMEDQWTIRFDLFQLEVDSVIGPDGPLAFDHDGEFLTVQLPAPPAVGEDQILTVHYGGSPYRDPQWGGFYFQQNYIYNLGIGISTIPPNFGKVWYPCFDSFVERATYTYHVKSSGTYRLHGQGTFLGEIQLGGDTVIRSYSMAQPIPTHLSAIAVADYHEHAYMHSGAFGQVPVTLRAKPNALTGMVNKFGQLGAAIDACEHWYGQYPFERVGYVHTVDGALEIPTNVAYPAFMNQQSDLNNRRLYTHELGHHWWGDIVTPHIHNDMWLKEGPAEYSEHLVTEWVDGAPGLVQAVKDNLLYVLRQAHVNDDGFQSLSPMPDEHIYGTHTYYKGALVMHNLRGYMGDSLFRHALSSIQIDLAYSTITAEGFKEALEEFSGLDLDPFFDAWVFGPAYSVFEVVSHQAQQSGSMWNVQVQFSQKLRGGDNYHHMVPVDLTLISASGQEHEMQVILSGEVSEQTIIAPFEPVMVVLNRHARLNQARLDHEVLVPGGTTLDQNLPHVEFRAFVDETPEDLLLRVEHLWVGPDPAPVAPDVLEISTTHFWNVDGLWPEGAALRGRVSYSGFGVNQLDHELFGGNEYGMCLLYRASPTDTWVVYPDQIVNAGNLINGLGNIVITALRKGQYAFGKTTGWVNVGEMENADEWSMQVHPVPANDVLIVQGSVPDHSTLILDIHTIDGRMAMRTTAAAHSTYREELNISKLTSGPYVIRVMTTDGIVIGTKRFEVVH